MAKNKIEIDVAVDDKGKTKKLGLETKKTSKEMGNLGKNARNADRNLKGAAAMSSNATKNFSKLQQGTGGLVAAYATLAARLFAVSAAFQFLKGAGELRSLQEGQLAYAASTGTAMRTLTNEIINATEAQVTFRDAAQAAAIGTASGLNPEQLTRLGKAAKDASLILGRDVTDSFNRLVRGVTKAEPELLDELGIILRLDTATENYARTIGKTKDELTQFERSQAVANEVLTQSEEKYSRILEITGASVNKFAQLGKAFDDIVNKIREVAAAVALPLAQVMIETPLAAIAAVGLLIKPVFGAILPGLNNVVGKTQELADTATESFKTAANEAEEFAKKIAGAKPVDATAAQQGVSGLLSGQVGRKGSILEQAKAGKQLSNRQIKQLQETIEKKGVLNKRELTKFKKHLKDMRLANSAENKRMAHDYELALKQREKGLKKFEMKAKGTFARISQFGAKSARFISIAFSAIGYLGIIAMLVMTVKQFRKTKEEVEEQAPAFDYLGEKVDSVNEELKNFNKIQNILNEDGTRTIQTLEAMGKAMANYSASEFEQLSKTFDLEKKRARIELGAAGDVVFAASTAAMTDKERKRFEELQKDLENQIRIGDRGRMGGGTAYIDQARQRLQNFQSQAMREMGITGDMLVEANKIANMSVAELMDPEKSKKLLETLKREKESIEGSTDEKIRGSKAAQAYVKAIKDIETGTAENTDELNKTRESYKNLALELGSLTRLQEENDKTAQDLRQSLFPESKYEKYIKTLKEEIRLQKIHAADSEKARPGAELEIKRLEDEVGLMERLNSLLREQNTEREKLKLQKEAALAGNIFGFQDKRTNREFRVRQLALEADLLEKRLAHEMEIATEKDGINEAELALITKTHQQIALNEIKLRQARDELTVMHDINDTFVRSFESGLTAAFDQIITGTKSVKDAFLTMTQGILRALSKVISEMLAVYVIQELLGFGKTTPAAPIIPKINIPIADTAGPEFRRGGIMKGYSTGGVARGPDAGYPAILHGSEAVVPLPDGRNIPVDLKGSSGTQNNIVVNVSSDGRTTTEGSSGPDAENMGRAIAKAVQTELQNQKRSGGILSPYGVA